MDTKLKIAFIVFITCVLSLYLINNNKFLDAVGTMQQIRSQVTFLLENNDVTEDTELHGYNIKILESNPIIADETNSSTQYFEITKDEIHLWVQKTSTEEKAEIKILKHADTDYGFTNDRSVENNLIIITICYAIYVLYLWNWYFKRKINIFSMLGAGFCFCGLNGVISFFIFPFASAYNMGMITGNMLRTMNLVICCAIIITNLQMTNKFVEKAKMFNNGRGENDDNE